MPSEALKVWQLGEEPDDVMASMATLPEWNPWISDQPCEICQQKVSEYIVCVGEDNVLVCDTDAPEDAYEADAVITRYLKEHDAADRAQRRAAGQANLIKSPAMMVPLTPDGQLDCGGAHEQMLVHLRNRDVA